MFLLKRNKTKQEKRQLDYEHLGKMLNNIYETGYIDRNQLYKMSFLKGLLSGLGGVVGATIVVALLLWVLSLLNDVPFVGRITNNVRQTLQKGPE